MFSREWVACMMLVYSGFSEAKSNVSGAGLGFGVVVWIGVAVLRISS